MFWPYVLSVLIDILINNDFKYLQKFLKTDAQEKIFFLKQKKKKSVNESVIGTLCFNLAKLYFGVFKEKLHEAS